MLRRQQIIGGSDRCPLRGSRQIATLARENAVQVQSQEVTATSAQKSARAPMASAAVTLATPGAATRQGPTSESCLPRCQYRGTPRRLSHHQARPVAGLAAGRPARCMQGRAAAARRRSRLAQQVARAQGTAELADLDDFDGQIVDADVIDNRIPVTVGAPQDCACASRKDAP
jgi:hypothetical protein